MLRTIRCLKALSGPNLISRLPRCATRATYLGDIDALATPTSAQSSRLLSSLLHEGRLLLPDQITSAPSSITPSLSERPQFVSELRGSHGFSRSFFSHTSSNRSLTEDSKDTDPSSGSKNDVPEKDDTTSKSPNLEKPDSSPEAKSDEKEGEKQEKGNEEQEEDKRALLELLAKREAEVDVKDKEIKKLHDALLRSYAEMENLRERTKREVDSSRKFAVQDFAKALLDVADNLDRAASSVPQSFHGAQSTTSTEPNHSGLDQTSSELDKEQVSVMLTSLLEGVNMTSKQLTNVFKKNGLTQFDPTGDNFDPNLHNAIFEISDESKPVGTIAVVIKTGYKLNDRVIRPAEVGVVKDPNA